MEVRGVEGHPDMMVVRGFTPLQEFYLQRMWYLSNLVLVFGRQCPDYPLIARAMFSTYLDLWRSGFPKEVLDCICVPKQPPVDEGEKRLAQAVREEMEGEE